MSTMIERTADAGHSAPRTPRAIHAVLLLSMSSLGVMVTAVLGPTVPQMQTYFAATAGAEYLVPLAVTIPMLVIAILSVFAGAIADRFGRKRMLVGALFLYGLIGIAPLWLDTLSGIIAARLLLGVFDAVIMTVSTVMIGDYYHGAHRQRMLALGTTVASISAVLLTVMGGVLGEHGWRAPYAVYAIGLVAAPLMQVFLWESGGRSRQILQSNPVEVDEVSFRPRLLIGICCIGLLVGVVFITVAIHLGFLLGALGFSSSQLIGASASLNSVGVVVGTLLFGWVIAPRLRVSYQLACALAACAAGFIWMGVAGTYTGLTAAAALNGIGCGILLPTLSTWNMRELPYSKRGLGTGAFLSSTFLGMAINPLIVVYLANTLNGRAAAVAAIGWVMAATALIAVFIGRIGSGSHSPTQSPVSG